MSKRPHDGDRPEVPDAKRAALDISDQPHPRHGNMPQTASTSNEPPEGIRRLIAHGFSMPLPVHDDVHIVVDTAACSDYFGCLWDTIVHLLYPDFQPDELLPAPITRLHFILVCRYLMKARIDHVYSSVTGRRPAHRIPLCAGLVVPAALAHIINGIGQLTVNNHALCVVPQPEAVPAEAADRLENQTTSVIQRAFSSLVNAAIRRNLINPGYLSRVVEGTAWWILSSRDGSQTAEDAVFDNNVVVIRSVFPEWQPADALLTAVVCRGFDGLFGDIEGDMFTSEPIRSLTHLRDDYNTYA